MKLHGWKINYIAEGYMSFLVSIRDIEKSIVVYVRAFIVISKFLGSA